MLAETSCSNNTLSEFSLDFFKRVFIVFKLALSNCALIYPKQERIETNGDGVKQGYPPKTFRRGLGAQMFNGGHIPPAIEHFCPVPICFGVAREFMQHSLGVCVVLKDAFSNFSSESYLDFPLFPFGLSSPVSD